MCTKAKSQEGITLIEIMVALSLSLIILAGVMHIFINNKQTYRVQEAFARLQENGRFAMQFIIKDVRMAGYVGCGGKISDRHVNADLDKDKKADDVAKFAESGIEGYEHQSLPVVLSTDTTLSTPTDITLGTSDVVPGTDIIRIKRAASTGIRLAGNLPPSNANVQVDATLAQGIFQTDDYVFISDCQSSDVFVAGTVSTNPGGKYITIAHAKNKNVDQFLSKPYGADAEIYKFVNDTYYVGKNGAGEPALFRRSLLNAGALSKEELVEGIEDMQVLYGEDTDGDSAPNKYVAANTVANWDNIVSARIELQVRSVEDNLAKEKSGKYKDRRLRRSFTTSIALRNRAI